MNTPLLLQPIEFNTDTIKKLDVMLPSSHCYIYYVEANSLILNKQKVVKSSIFTHPVLNYAFHCKATPQSDVWGFQMPINALYRVGIPPNNTLINLRDLFQEEIDHNCPEAYHGRKPDHRPGKKRPGKPGIQHFGAKPEEKQKGTVYLEVKSFYRTETALRQQYSLFPNTLKQKLFSYLRM
ncbi:hypothetical protein AAG747_23435 [Rapidithrix thailandica]|uniref:Uncharacterized protein n=1 Tax=Rapidithrix thailandica TaxID=413964 RepID=A0AAW9SHY2_9BACT